MMADMEVADLRDQVLRKIGRNVVNFQKMEAMLKVLNSHQQVSGALSDLPRLFAKASKSTSKLSMGRLADAFIRSVYSTTEGHVEQRDHKEISISFSLNIEADPVLTKERKKALNAVVAERNKLIHEWLANFDPNSMKSCAQLQTELDKQHARIWPEFEMLKSIVQTSKELIDKLTRHLTSDEFLGEVEKGEPSG
jgi:hypothetical protein